MRPADTPQHAIEEQLGVLIVEGQRIQVWIRSEPDDDGTWHNTASFRRDGKLSPARPLITGLEWHVPPGIALQRARDLEEAELIELYRRALRRRPPLA